MNADFLVAPIAASDTETLRATIKQRIAAVKNLTAIETISIEIRATIFVAGELALLNYPKNAAASQILQIVEEAVHQACDELDIPLIRESRTILRVAILPRHLKAAKKLQASPNAVVAGYADALSIARSEKAIERVYRRSISAHPALDQLSLGAALHILIIQDIMKTLIASGVQVSNLSDEQLLATTDHALKRVLPRVLNTQK